MPRQTGWLLVVTYSIGVVMLMTAGIYDGPLAEPALVVVLACAAILGVQFRRLLLGRESAAISPKIPLLVAAAGLAVFALAIFADARLLIDAEAKPRFIQGIELCQLVLLGTYLPAVLRGNRESPLWIEIRFALFAAFLVLGGASVLALSPQPHIDVFTFHTEAARSLLRGENPYLLKMHETGPSGLVSLGFVYPATPAYLTLVGYVLGGDVRWAMLTALLVAGVAMRFVARRKGRNVPALGEEAPCLMLWLTPKAFFYIEQSWNDVFPVVFVALAVLAHVQDRRRWCAFFLGVALSTKQTMIWFVPLAVLLQFGRVEWSIFLGTAAALVVPLALWDYSAFHRNVVVLQGQLPPRHDGLTPMNWLYRHFGIVPRGATGIFLAVSLSALAVWRAPRSRTGFAVSVAVVFFAFYVFNKWTFMNYYFFLTGLAALAAATVMGETEAGGAVGVKVVGGPQAGVKNET